MKKILQTLLIVLLSFTLVSCVKDEEKPDIPMPDLVDRVEILTLLENADFTKFLNSRNQITLNGEFDRTIHEGELLGESVKTSESIEIKGANAYLIPLKKKEVPEENDEVKDEGEETPEEIIRGVLQLNMDNINYKKRVENYNLEGNLDEEIIETLSGTFQSVFMKEEDPEVKPIFQKNYIYLNPDLIKTINGIEKKYTTEQKIPQSALAPSIIDAIQSIVSDLVYFEVGDVIISDLLLQKIAHIEDIEITKQENDTFLDFSLEKDETFKIIKEITLKILEEIDEGAEIEFQLPFIIRMLLSSLDIKLPDGDMTKEDFEVLVKEINNKAKALNDFKIVSKLSFKDNKIHNINFDIKINYDHNERIEKIDTSIFNLDFNVNLKVVPNIPNLPEDLIDYYLIEEFPFKSDDEILELQENEKGV